jgi:hypothetical protein
MSKGESLASDHLAFVAFAVASILVIEDLCSMTRFTP